MNPDPLQLPETGLEPIARRAYRLGYRRGVSSVRRPGLLGLVVAAVSGAVVGLVAGRVL